MPKLLAEFPRGLDPHMPLPTVPVLEHLERLVQGVEPRWSWGLPIFSNWMALRARELSLAEAVTLWAYMPETYCWELPNLKWRRPNGPEASAKIKVSPLQIMSLLSDIGVSAYLRPYVAQFLGS